MEAQHLYRADIAVLVMEADLISQKILSSHQARRLIRCDHNLRN
jgi:hypothetical protein